MGKSLSRFELIDRGLDHHEAKQYRRALPYFEKAFLLEPCCPFAIYNMANTLHMLSEEHKAAQLLKNLLLLKLNDIPHDITANTLRVLQLDANYLMFLVMIYGQGFSREAFAFANKHLKQRKAIKGSVWSLAQVRQEIKEMRLAWLTNKAVC